MVTIGAMFNLTSLILLPFVSFVCTSIYPSIVVFSTHCTEDDTSTVSKSLRCIGSAAIGLYRVCL